MLRKYQSEILDKIGQQLELSDRCLIQLPTGSGKTVIFSALAADYCGHGKRVLILVHRRELMKQAVLHLKENGLQVYSLKSGGVKGSTLADSFSVVVAMERSYWRKKEFLKKFDLVIIDECHLNYFKKHEKWFSGYKTVGFTATPVRVKGGLINSYKKMIAGPGIDELVRDNYLSGMEVFVPEGISGENYLKEGIDPQEVWNSYEKLSLGKKTLIYNIRVSQSLLVSNIFAEHGIECRHLDGNTEAKERDIIIKWFKETEDAVLSNVMVTALGFDVADIDTVIVNRRTGSLALWMQMVGRGSRTAPEKNKFRVIDLGGNIFRFGIWENTEGWREKFRESEKKGKVRERIDKEKICEGCGMVCGVFKRKCPYCGHAFSVSYFDDLRRKFDGITEVKYGISIPLLIWANEKHPYRTLEVMGKKIREQLLRRTDIDFRRAESDYIHLYKSWCEKIGRDIDVKEMNEVRHFLR